MLRKLMVAIVLVLVLFPVAVAAQDIAPMWHCDAVSTPVAGNPGWNYTATGAGAFWRTKQVGGAVVGVVQTSPAFTHIALAGNTQYQVQAADSANGPWSNDASCIFTVAPLGVIISDFRATCRSSDVMLEWSVPSHINITRFLVAKDGDQVLELQADCPGCTSGATYTRYLALDDPTGIYTLISYNGDAISDVSEYQLDECQVPTAVHLASLKAQTEPPVPTENITLEFLGTLAGAALATWLTVNALVKAQPNWKAKIVAIPAALFWTVGASALLAYPDVTAATVFLAIANSLLVYFTATGGATMLAARAAEPKRAMANGKQPFNKAWW